MKNDYIESIAENIYDEYEKKRFREYCKSWQDDNNKNNIEEIWLSQDRDFFLFDDTIFRECVNNYEGIDFLNQIKNIEIPYIIYQYILVYKYKRGISGLCELIKSVPVCYSENKWNKNCVLPVIIDVLLKDYTYKHNIDFLIDWDFITNIIDKICMHRNASDVIRKYSVFLLLRRNYYTENIEKLIEICSQRISVDVNDYLLQQIITSGIAEKHDDFSNYGITQPYSESQMFHEILSYALYSTGNSTKLILNGFKYSLVYDDYSFAINNNNRKFKHYYVIASIYMELDDPVTAWIKHLNYFETIRYRIGYDYFDKNSKVGLRNLEYLLNVGKGIAKYLLDENRYREFDKIWDVIWRNVIDINMYQKGYHFEETFYMFIRYIVVLRFYALKQQDNTIDEIVNEIYDILLVLKYEYKCFLLTIEILMQNGYEKYIHRLNKDKIDYVNGHIENIVRFYSDDKREENIVSFACKIRNNIIKCVKISRSVD